MSYIETRLFHYFVAVAEERHFASAALRLGISPPTLTHQIQVLERHLGVRLLRRKGNTKVVITEAGERVLTRAREVLRQVEETTAMARQAGRGELGRLELGFMTVVSGAGLLRKWIGAFERAHPAIEFMVHKLSPLAQISGILRKDLDAGLTRMPDKYPTGIRGFEICRQGMALALPSEHPLARHKNISPATLAGEAFVSFLPEPDLGFSGYTETIGRIGKFTPRVVRRDDDLAEVLAYVGLGHGIAVVPELLKTANHADVVFRDIAADVPRTSIAFIYSSDPSPSAKLLIQYMQRHALRDHRHGPSRPHHQHRVVTPRTLNVDRHPDIELHPEALARRASLEGCGRGAAASP